MPPTVVFRPFTEDDIPAIVHIANESNRADGIDMDITEEMIRHQLRTPMIAPERDIRIVTLEDGTPVAMGVALLNPRTGAASGQISVLPDYRDQGIEENLIEQGDELIRTRGEAEVAAEKPVYVNRPANEDDHTLIARLQLAGYAEVRRFYIMHIDLDGPVDAPALPDGLALRPFDPETQAHAVHHAAEESFRDHWGHNEDRPFEEWYQRRIERPNFDPNLWFIAWDGDAVAGVSFCWTDDADESIGWVGTLGVRRPWRKRGLGMALLQHSFAGFQQRGVDAVRLGVDAASKTNAVALYERAGMHIHLCTINFRRVLRGDAGMIVD